MATVYEIMISESENQETYAELPTDVGVVEFNFHIRKCFTDVFLDVYVDGFLLAGSILCLKDRYVFSYLGYVLYYTGENSFEWRKYDLA